MLFLTPSRAIQEKYRFSAKLARKYFKNTIKNGFSLDPQQNEGLLILLGTLITQPLIF